MCGFGAVGTGSAFLPLLMTSLLVFAAVAGAGIGWGVLGRRAGPTGYQIRPAAQPTPLELLRERYVRDEIDLGEFEERAMLIMRSQLGPSHPLSHPSSDERIGERTTL